MPSLHRQQPIPGGEVDRVEVAVDLRDDLQAEEAGQGLPIRDRRQPSAGVQGARRDSLQSALA